MSQAKLFGDDVPFYERNMNPEQLEAIRHQDGPCVLLAQAGSGKTRCLVHRVARLIAHGINEESILAVTFAKKAATEMNERLKSLGVKKARVGTWHSLCLQIVREDETPWRNWAIDDHENAKYILKDVLGFKGLNWQDADLGQVQRFIGLCKANLYGSSSEDAQELAFDMFDEGGDLAMQAYLKYQEQLALRAIMTFDDFLVYAWLHLRDETNRRSWAAKWRYVLIDEAQDNNYAQKCLQEMLARDHRNIMVVGDVAQAIFGFRGSKPDYLAGFAEEWGARTIVMNRNYRSGSKIVQVANDVIRRAEYRVDADMVAERSEDGEVDVVASGNFDDEADTFLRWLQKHISSGDKLSDCTVLYRTNAQSRALEEVLIGSKIPYVIAGGSGFYERKEVRDVLAYVRVATRRNNAKDNVKRCLNAPFRYLGKAFIDRVLESWTDDADPTALVRDVATQAGIQRRQLSSALEWASLMEQLREQVLEDKPADVLGKLVNRTQYLEWLRKDEGEESVETSHQLNVRELIRTADRFPTVVSLLDYIDKTIAAAARHRKDKQAGGERVLLMTIHRAKGLEWPHLFVAGCNDLIIPHVRGEPEEERRLMYVAVTRARDSLTLSYVKLFARPQGIVDAEPSPFLIEAGLLDVGDGTGMRCEGCGRPIVSCVCP
jgi:DNA helicase-2/ATP-dependent DNA helicase PcrA